MDIVVSMHETAFDVNNPYWKLLGRSFERFIIWGMHNTLAPM
jgi:hypothetical protein